MKRPQHAMRLFAAALTLAALVVSGSALAQTARVIVKFRSDSTQARAAALATDRVQTLGNKLGVSLQAQRRIATYSQVVTASGMSSEALASTLAASSEVEYAVPDRIFKAAAVPNDPLYSSDQWYLQTTETAAIRAQTAWDTTTGSTSVVVADIDTGVRFDHEDLSGQLIQYGYDFISSTTCPTSASDTSTICSSDGQGRHADASDPGDYNPADSTSTSSWHGTRVSGLIGASANNSRGIAGVAWQLRILPVRVLGTNGGWESDIIAGMRWAAGLSVDGVPSNTTPAKILNLSLGGSGSCDQSYQEAVNEVIAQGAVVVVAAGNNGGAVSTPANCSGVLAVAALRNVGTKVGYSNLGAQIGIAAPGGNCGFGSTCAYSIISTTNLGTTTPGTNGYTTSGSSDADVGTSFSAPLASGVLALMYAQNSALTPAQAIARLKTGARAFPTVNSVPTCPSTNSNGECNCTTSTCGAGMLDAPGAIAEAQRPIANIVLPTTLTAGSATTLDGSSSAAMTGASIARYQWSVSGTVTSLSNSDKSVATLIVPAAGSYTITLKVTDNNGKTDQSSTTAQFTTASSVSTGSSSSSSSSGSSSGSSSSSSSSSSSGGGGGGGGASWLSLLGIAALGAMARRARR